LVFHTPVSTGKNKGNKTQENDWRTPVGKFAIS
jgi:murein L,D-transpeptidase YafK